MASFSRAGHERVNVFEVDDRYLFKHYFEGEDVFDRLKRYYDNQGYRFEVPPDALEDLVEFLEKHGYSLVTVPDVEPYVVVVRKYTAHPENIFKASVIHRSADDYNCFLMTDQEAVAKAVAEGADRLTETDLKHPF